MVPGIYGEFTHNSEKWGVIAGLRGDYTSISINILLPHVYILDIVFPMKRPLS